eukprot:1154618-Pelagomonas_calceolata.AAC.1
MEWHSRLEVQDAIRRNHKLQSIGGSGRCVRTPAFGDGSAEQKDRAKGRTGMAGGTEEFTDEMTFLFLAHKHHRTRPCTPALSARARSHTYTYTHTIGSAGNMFICLGKGGGLSEEGSCTPYRAAAAVGDIAGVLACSWCCCVCSVLASCTQEQEYVHTASHSPDQSILVTKEDETHTHTHTREQPCSKHPTHWPLSHASDNQSTRLLLFQALCQNGPRMGPMPQAALVFNPIQLASSQAS